ncbi:MAG TPA: amidase [Bacteroidetes bacterium]|nr:amidase [Bacteroidota bacterium]
MTISRRAFIAALSALGVSPAAIAKVAGAQNVSTGEISEEDLKNAEKIIGLHFTDENRKLMIRGIRSRLKGYESLRTLKIDNSIPPALSFSPLTAGMTVQPEKNSLKYSRLKSFSLPQKEEKLAFLPVTHLAHLIKTQQISSLDLTKLYLERLKKYDPVLHCVITLTEEPALRQAKQADREIRVGNYRGPLHGIPWGAKDLFAVKGYKTTWGAMPYKDQTIDKNATVVEKLNNAGAVLVAKLTLGALAMGDVWFGGKTRNPWNPEQGSSGSSAGPASATAAGLVGFSIGTETLGSIVSPSSRCGATGLRPTFGRVSRAGAMALSWSMDKIGPICRSVEDCALVFQAIHGTDGKDLTVHDFPFYWNPDRNVKQLKIGYVKEYFAGEQEADTFAGKVPDTLKSLGFHLKEIELPEFPYGGLRPILSAEAAAAFDEITRNGEVDSMVRQDRGAWPNSFRTSRFIPAVEYIQANRARTILMEKMATVMSSVDVIVSPPFAGPTLLLTNLTGHPVVVLPNGFREDGTPVSITFIGNLFKESDALAVAKAYQDATGFHLQHPKLTR